MIENFLFSPLCGACGDKKHSRRFFRTSASQHSYSGIFIYARFADLNIYTNEAFGMIENFLFSPLCGACGDKKRSRRFFRTSASQPSYSGIFIYARFADLNKYGGE